MFCSYRVWAIHNPARIGLLWFHWRTTVTERVNLERCLHKSAVLGGTGVCFFHGDFLRVCHPTVLCSFSLLAQGHCGETAVLNFWLSGAILVFSDNSIPVQGRKVQSTGIEPAGDQWGISLVNCCRKWQWPSLGRVLDCVWVEKRSWENKQVTSISLETEHNSLTGPIGIGSFCLD